MCNLIWLCFVILVSFVNYEYNVIVDLYNGMLL